MDSIPNTTTNAGSKYSWLPHLAVIIAASTGLVYFLGRLYVESYYSVFFIPSGSISLSPQEYMYFCIPVAMLLIGELGGIWLTYRSFVNNWPFFVDTSDKQDKVVTQIAFVTLFVGSSIAHCIWFLTTKPSCSLAAIAGISLGMSLGIISIPLAWLLHCWARWAHNKPVLPSISNAAFSAAMMIIYIFASLPLFTSALAEGVAKADYSRLPISQVFSAHLPSELRANSPEGNSVNAKVLLINGDRLYFSVSRSTNDQGALPSNPLSNHVLYVMNISQMDYLRSGTSENISALNK